MGLLTSVYTLHSRLLDLSVTSTDVLKNAPGLTISLVWTKLVGAYIFLENGTLDFPIFASRYHVILCSAHSSLCFLSITALWNNLTAIKKSVKISLFTLCCRKIFSIPLLSFQ
jgi:hypothetical protein